MLGRTIRSVASAVAVEAFPAQAEGRVAAAEAVVALAPVGAETDGLTRHCSENLHRLHSRLQDRTRVA